MRLIKKIDRYLLRSFLTYFFMTFFICILVLLMQTFWKQMPDLIGKGVGWQLLAEFFWYAAVQTIPMALPLAILLAALMNFGNLGENFELTAMKSAGISLFRIMRGLIVFIALVCIGAFFFSNNVLPQAQTKFWTLIYSLRSKSPEFEIPEGQFYNGIAGYNLYVREKDRANRMLHNLMIYDYSNGFDNALVMLADSGKVEFTADNKYLKLTLFSGESFQNLRNNQAGARHHATNIPYRRELFASREILLDFNTEFNRYDESIFKDQYVSKNTIQLMQTIDSVSKITDARANEQVRDMLEMQYHQLRRITHEPDTHAENTPSPTNNSKTDAAETARLNVDSLFLSLDQSEMLNAASAAHQNANQMKDKVAYNKIMLDEPANNVRKHQIELHRKFTLSFACLIFFFIGAPLGAIVRKGGLGFPVVISVVLFIIYYIIDNTGYKMARQGIWEVYQGMWLSSAVLFPFGIFLTWKAVTDSSVFRSESYLKTLEQLKTHFTRLFASRRSRNPM